MSDRTGIPLIIHAGFHKTGTSTVQAALAENRAVLSDYRIILKPDIPDLCEAARTYSADPDRRLLARFGQLAVQQFGGQDDPRPTLISAEDLAGIIPGRKGRRGYPAAAPVIRTLCAAFPQHRPTVYFSTRAAAAWMKSCHAHNVRHTRLRRPLDAYCTYQGVNSDLTAIAARIAAKLRGVPVVHSALEDIAALPQGPLTPLLDLLDVPAPLRDRLVMPPVANASLPDHVIAALLELNQSDLDRDALQARKLALIADHHRTEPT